MEKKDFNLIEEMDNEQIPELDGEVKILAKKLYVKSEKLSKRIWLSAQVTAISCAVLVFSFLFLYGISSKASDFPVFPVDRYFDDNKINFVDKSDLQQFAKENKLNIKFLDFELGINNVAYIKDTNELALILQQAFFVGDSYDQVELGINLLPNTTYDKFKKFTFLNRVVSVGGVNVNYRVLLNDKGENVVLAKFSLENEYFLQIVTDSVDGKLEHYLTMLLI